jgi:hypothetical protein
MGVFFRLLRHYTRNRAVANSETASAPLNESPAGWPETRAMSYRWPSSNRRNLSVLYAVPSAHRMR